MRHDERLVTDRDTNAVYGRWKSSPISFSREQHSFSRPSVELSGRNQLQLGMTGQQRSAGHSVGLNANVGPQLLALLRSKLRAQLEGPSRNDILTEGGGEFTL